MQVEAAAERAQVDLLMVDDPPLRPGAPGCAAPGGAKGDVQPVLGPHSAGSMAFQLLGGLLALQAGRPLGRVLAGEGGAARKGRLTVRRRSCHHPGPTPGWLC